MEDGELNGGFLPILLKPPALLPITRHRNSLLYMIEENPVTIVVAATGSGKTTQIPQYLQQEGWCSDGKMIAVTQVGKSGSREMFTICSKRDSLEEWQLRAWQLESQRKCGATLERKSAIQSGSRILLLRPQRSNS